MLSSLRSDNFRGAGETTPGRDTLGPDSAPRGGWDHPVPDALGL